MKKIILSAAVTLFAACSFAQKSQVFIKDGYAVNGYDVVAYFKENKSVQGRKAFLYQWHDANWLFSSKENLETFSHDPEKYAPQFGGYCAYGVSEGHKASTYPDAFTIVDNKLYLNYNKDVLQLWRKDISGRIKKGEENWTKVKDSE